MNIVEFVDGITDNVIAFALVGAGIYFIDKGQVDIGQNMITMAVGYIFGKSVPSIKGRAVENGGGL